MSHEAPQLTGPSILKGTPPAFGGSYVVLRGYFLRVQISIRDFNRRWSLGGFNDDQERIGDIFARKEPSTARLASFAVTKPATIPTRTFGTAGITELPRLAKTRLVFPHVY